MTDTLKRQLSAAASNRQRALAHYMTARPNTDEQRERLRNLIICDRAFNDARRAYENAQKEAAE